MYGRGVCYEREGACCTGGNAIREHMRVLVDRDHELAGRSSAEAHMLAYKLLLGESLAASLHEEALHLRGISRYIGDGHDKLAPTDY